MVQNPRLVIENLDGEFAKLHERSCRIINVIPSDTLLYANPRHTPGCIGADSVGEGILLSAAAVEQTFGGITANLWDDPHEWTLPETLSTRELVIAYLIEVEETRQRAFAGFSSDAELLKDIVLPSDLVRPLIGVLLDTLVRAAGYQGEAASSLKCLSDVSVRGVII